MADQQPPPLCSGNAPLDGLNEVRYSDTSDHSTHPLGPEGVDDDGEPGGEKEEGGEPSRRRACLGGVGVGGVGGHSEWVDSTSRALAAIRGRLVQASEPGRVGAAAQGAPRPQEVPRCVPRMRGRPVQV